MVMEILLKWLGELEDWSLKLLLVVSGLACTPLFSMYMVVVSIVLLLFYVLLFNMSMGMLLLCVLNLLVSSINCVSDGFSSFDGCTSDLDSVLFLFVMLLCGFDFLVYVSLNVYTVLAMVNPVYSVGSSLSLNVLLFCSFVSDKGFVIVILSTLCCFIAIGISELGEGCLVAGSLSALSEASASKWSALVGSCSSFVDFILPILGDLWGASSSIVVAVLEFLLILPYLLGLGVASVVCELWDGDSEGLVSDMFTFLFMLALWLILCFWVDSCFVSVMRFIGSNMDFIVMLLGGLLKLISAHLALSTICYFFTDWFLGEL